MSTHPSLERFGTAIMTVLALAAFAANSVICRQALGSASIDPAGFTAIRLASGAAALLLLSRLTGRRTNQHPGGWGPAAALFVYAAAFSFAYVSLPSGTGALILFGAVQATMIISGLRSGERPRPIEWGGLCIALAGLVILVLPGLSAPSPAGSALMTVAGISWGCYSLSGREAGNPVAVTTANFVRSVPLAVAAALIMLPELNITVKGAVLAASSGSLASAGGYIVWYAVLPRLTATLAATVQLIVPVLAAAGGTLLLSEQISARLFVSALAILGGVATAACRARAITDERPAEE